MHRNAESHTTIIAADRIPAGMTLTVLFSLLFAALIAQPAQGQTYTVIHNFTGGANGAYPFTGLSMDPRGNLYGTTLYGGSQCSGGCGVVFRLQESSGEWAFMTLYSFRGGSDGGGPWGRVAIAADGSLYGNTAEDNNGDFGPGTIFHLRPSAITRGSTVAPWAQTVLDIFDGADGATPQGDVVLDQTDNIYGTTISGGLGPGVIYKLIHSDGHWTEDVLYYCGEGNGDGAPYGGVILHPSGNLYGTFVYGPPYNSGAIYQLTPSESGWSRQLLYQFTGGDDGSEPEGGLILDSSGNLYGTTTGGGTGGGGTVFELLPSNGAWVFKILYNFSNCGSGYCGPVGKLVMDVSGNLYGTTSGDGAYGKGSVFKLSPSGGGWIYTSLHDFTGGSDGENPLSAVVSDTNGNLYGTASTGGAFGYGVVWKITP